MARSNPQNGTIDIYGHPVPHPSSGIQKGVRHLPDVATVDDSVNVVAPYYWLQDHEYLTDTSMLTCHDPAIFTDHFREDMADLSYGHWVANGLPGIDTYTQLQGTDTVNFTVAMSFYASVSGNIITITNSVGGCQNPRNLSIQTSFVRADENEGNAYFNTVGCSIRPGWQIAVLGKKGLIKRIVSSNSTTTVLEMSRTFPSYTGTVQCCADVADPERWPRINPARAMWSTRKSIRVNVSEVPPNKTVELFDASEHSCQIATPIKWEYNKAVSSDPIYSSPTYAGTFRVMSSAGQDITSYFLDNKKLHTTCTHAATFSTTLVLDYSAETKFYVIDYCPESSVLDGSDENVHCRSLKSCVNNLRDWTESLGNTGVVWGQIDPKGGHWYCQCGLLAGNLTGQYNWQCNATDCPNYRSMSETGGWHPNNADWRKIWFGKNLYTVQAMAGNPTRLIGRASDGVPSILWLAGMHQFKYNDSGLYTNREEWVGTSSFGYLGTTDGSGYRPFVSGAVKADGSGVLKSGSTFPVQSGCDGLPLNDGSDHAQIMSYFVGVRESPVTLGQAQVDARGYCESMVQRIRPRKFTLKNIDLSPEMIGKPQVLEQDTVVVHQDNNLYLFVQRYAWTGPVVDVPDQSRRVHDFYFEDNQLVLNMSLGIESCEYYQSSEGDGSSLYLQGGLSVDPPEWKKPRNFGNSNSASMIGNASKFRRGQVIWFPDLPEPYCHMRVPITYAQAFGGPKMTTSISYVGVHTMEFRVPGAWDGPGGLFAVNNVQFYNQGAEYACQDWTFGRFDLINDLYPVHRVRTLASGRNGWVVPSRTKINQELLAAYLDAAGNGGVVNYDYLKYDLVYTPNGGTTERARIPFYQMTVGHGGSPFLSLPCRTLATTPDLKLPVKVEYYDEFTKQWVDAHLTHDGQVHWTQYPEGRLPEHGKLYFWFRGNTNFVTFPNELWGYTVRLTLSYVGWENYSPYTLPNGPGFPQGFEDYRTNMDQIRCDMSGYWGQALAWYMQNNAWLQSPFCLWVEGGMMAQIRPVNQGVTVKHIVEDGNGTIESETDASAFHDPANSDVEHGMWTMCVSGVDQWDRSKKHDLHIAGNFLDMMPTCPAELVTGLDYSIRQLRTFRATFSTSQLLYSASQYPGVIPPQGSWSLGSMVLPFTYQTEQLKWYPIDQWWYSQNFGLDYVIGAWLDSYPVFPAIAAMNVVPVTIIGNMDSRLSSRVIKNAYLDIEIGQASISQRTYQVRNGVTVVDRIDIQPMSGLSIYGSLCTFDQQGNIIDTQSTSFIGNLPQLRRYNVNGQIVYRATAEVKPLAQYLADNYLPDNQKICVFLSGTTINSTDAGTTHGFLKQWATCDGSDINNWTAVCGMLRFRSIAVENLRIDYDWDGIRSSRPQVVAGNFPPLVNP